MDRRKSSEPEDGMIAKIKAVWKECAIPHTNLKPLCNEMKKFRSLLFMSATDLFVDKYQFFTN